MRRTAGNKDRDDAEEKQNRKFLIHTGTWMGEILNAAKGAKNIVVKDMLLPPWGQPGYHANTTPVTENSADGNRASCYHGIPSGCHRLHAAGLGSDDNNAGTGTFISTGRSGNYNPADIRSHPGGKEDGHVHRIG